MLTIRPGHERGHANHGWLNSYHSFSFASYYDPRYMGVSCLRVINDDTVAPGAGFSTHGHRDMEIISYVLSGGLEHKDSMGNGSVIRPGEVQRMSAGRGIQHSEFNASRNETVNFLQIWIRPNVSGTEPNYAQKDFSQRLDGKLALVVSPDGRDDSLSIHQDVLVYAARLQKGQHIHHASGHGRKLYLHLARGVVSLNTQTLEAGGGATLIDEALELDCDTDAEFLLFDLP
ncbi:MAG: pirin family protein [Gammaproteobacteria bacterium]|nr:pirin family protein [Gammaproteobacteria bacterium]